MHLDIAAATKRKESEIVSLTPMFEYPYTDEGESALGGGGG